MKLLKTKALTVGAGLLLATAPAFAVVINNINVPTSEGPHTLSGSLTENLALNVGDELTGYGRVDAIDDNRPICGSGDCQLTYTFSGYRVEEITPTQANFSGGEVNFYASDSGYNTEDPSTASQGTLFLSLAADPEPGTPFTLEGTLTNDGTDQAQNTAVGLLSVTGGSAADIFDNDSYENGNGGLSDLLFNTSLSPIGEMRFRGSADADYIRPGEVTPPASVPEPSELAMLSLGLVLIGLGVYRHRRQGDAV